MNRTPFLIKEYGTPNYIAKCNKHQIMSDDAVELNSILSNLMDEHEEFSRFINLCSISIAGKRGNPIFYKRICCDLEDMDTNANDRYLSKFVDYGFDTVTFSDFGKTALLNMLCDGRTVARENVSNFLNSLGNPYLIIQPEQFSEKIFNINPDQKGMGGSFVNFNDLVQCLRNVNFQSSRRYLSHNFNHICEVITIGKNNAVAAIITIDGEMLIRWQVYKSIRKRSIDEVKDFLYKVFSRFVSYNDMFSNANINVIDEHSLQLVKSSVRSAISQRAIDEYFYSGDTDESRNKARYEWILSKANEITKSLMNEMNSREITSQIWKDLKRSFNSQVATIRKEAFKNGMASVTKFAKLGWYVVENNSEIKGLNDSDQRTFWKKEINLISDMFAYDGKLYKIPEETRKVHITHMYITDGEIRIQYAKGSESHPNVSGTRVCLGDLEWQSGKLSDTDEEELIDLLERAQTFLRTFNYDSSYHNFGKNECVKSIRSDNEITTDASKMLQQSKSKTTTKSVRKVIRRRNSNKMLVDDPVVKDNTHYQTVFTSPRVDNMVDDNSPENAERILEERVRIPNIPIDEYQSTIREMLRMESGYNDIHVNFSNAIVWTIPDNGINFGVFTDEFGCYYLFFIKNKYSRPKELQFNHFCICLKHANVLNVGDNLNETNIVDLFKYLDNWTDTRFKNELRYYLDNIKRNLTNYITIDSYLSSHSHDDLVPNPFNNTFIDNELEELDLESLVNEAINPDTQTNSIEEGVNNQEIEIVEPIEENHRSNTINATSSVLEDGSIVINLGV